MAKSFAFLVHPRDRMDWKNTFWPAHFLPNSALNYVGALLKKKKLSTVCYKGIEGHLINIPLLPERIMEKPHFTQECILEASRFAIEKLGVKVIGLGALLAPVTAGGKWLKRKLSNHVVVTNGNSLTAAMTSEGIKKAATIKGWRLDNGARIAILGATGSVGRGVSQLLAEDLDANLLLISRTRRKLENLRERLEKINPNIKIDISINVEDIKKANLVIILTSGPDVIVSENYLKEHAVVYDVTQPSNIDPAILAERKDLLVVDGGLVTTPGVDWKVNLRLPQDTSFGCLAETIFLAESGGFEHLDFTGPVNTETARHMAEIAKRHGFKHAPLTSFRRLVLKEEMRGQIYLADEKYLKRFTLLL